jgi:hypothetical protein
VVRAGGWGVSPRPSDWLAVVHAARAWRVVRVRRRGVAAVARSPGPPWGAGPLGGVWGRAPARIPGPQHRCTAESTLVGWETPRRADVATSRPKRASALDVSE